MSKSSLQMKFTVLLSLFLVSASSAVRAANSPVVPVALVESRRLTLDNGSVRRVITVGENGNVTTTELTLPGGDGNFVTGDLPGVANQKTTGGTRGKKGAADSAEFSFTANGGVYSGKTDWKFLGLENGLKEGAG